MASLMRRLRKRFARDPRPSSALRITRPSTSGERGTAYYTFSVSPELPPGDYSADELRTLLGVGLSIPGDTRVEVVNV